MPIDVIVGGQGGDEGKGKIAQYLASSGNYTSVIRAGGPQSGHSIIVNGKRMGLATIPCGFENSNLKIIIGRGGYIYVPSLLKEIEETGLKKSNRIIIDNYSTIVTEAHRNEERANANLMGKIGSVGTGVGIARIAKLRREKENPEEMIKFAKDIPELQDYVGDSVGYLNRELEKGNNILIEGDQGFKLNIDGEEYPFVSTTNAITSSFLMRTQVNPKELRDVYIVVKPYTTRVAPGNLEDEIFNEKILEWCHNEGGEKGTVSERLRRISEFEWNGVKRAIQVNGATKIAITHMDFFKGTNQSEEEFLKKLKTELTEQYPFPKLALLSYGPKLHDVIPVNNVEF